MAHMTLSGVSGMCNGVLGHVILWAWKICLGKGLIDILAGTGMGLQGRVQLCAGTGFGVQRCCPNKGAAE